MAELPLSTKQWRHIAVQALADLEALGSPIGDLPAVKPHREAVLSEVDRYVWEREKYT